MYFILGSQEGLKYSSKVSKGEVKYISNLWPFLILRGEVEDSFVLWSLLIT